MANRNPTKTIPTIAPLGNLLMDGSGAVESGVSVFVLREGLPINGGNLCASVVGLGVGKLEGVGDGLGDSVGFCDTEGLEEGVMVGRGVDGTKETEGDVDGHGIVGKKEGIGVGLGDSDGSDDAVGMPSDGLGEGAGDEDGELEGTGSVGKNDGRGVGLGDSDGLLLDGVGDGLGDSEGF